MACPEVRRWRFRLPMLKLGWPTFAPPYIEERLRKGSKSKPWPMKRISTSSRNDLDIKKASPVAGLGGSDHETSSVSFPFSWYRPPSSAKRRLPHSYPQRRELSVSRGGPRGL